MRSAVSLILTLYLSIVFPVFESFGELDSGVESSFVVFWMLTGKAEMFLEHRDLWFKFIWR